MRLYGRMRWEGFTTGYEHGYRPNPTRRSAQQKREWKRLAHRRARAVRRREEREAVVQSASLTEVAENDWSDSLDLSPRWGEGLDWEGEPA